VPLRAYHWGEDGLAGLSDDHQRLCFAVRRLNADREIDEPHAGQKCLRIGLPLPPMLLNVFSVPSTVIASLATRISAAKALPVNFGNPGNGTLLRSSGRPWLYIAPRHRGSRL
jgi:hypothetical protein